MMEKPGPIRTCVYSKYISTGSRSNMTSSIDSINQLFMRSLPSPQNRQKPSEITTNYGKPRTNSYLCRFQVNHCWFQVESVNLSLKLAMADLESTQVRIGPRFFHYGCVLLCFFAVFWVLGDKEQWGKNIISGIDRAHWALSGTSITTTRICCRTNRTWNTRIVPKDILRW